MKVIGDTTFFTTSEVASKIGVGEHTVRLYIRDGVLPASKVGRSYWVSETALRDYVRRKYQIDL